MNKKRRDELGRIAEAIEAAMKDLAASMSFMAASIAIDAANKRVTEALGAFAQVMADERKARGVASTKECKQCGALNMPYKKLCSKCFCPSFHEPTEKEDA